MKTKGNYIFSQDTEEFLKKEGMDRLFAKNLPMP